MNPASRPKGRYSCSRIRRLASRWACLSRLNTPISEVSGTRGGTENSLTKIFVKPTHMIGGYAQLSYGFNYYGPTGSQRDELTVMRKRESEVVY